VEAEMSIEAMKQALEALEDPWKSGPDGVASAITAIRAAIEQAEKRQWVELTDDEARALVNRATFGDRTNWQALVYMVDAKLKEKNA
jgi:cob(I)alamin adenosyltransferase